MPRKKKNPKLPNGYGSIKRLSGNRRNPYAVYPPATEQIKAGQYTLPKALCYVDTWMKGFTVLTAYHAGNYYPGYERELNDLSGTPEKLLADYTQAYRNEMVQKQEPTFAEVYEQFYKHKYEDPNKTYSAASMRSTSVAYKNCKVLHDKIFRDLRYQDLQDVVDSCPLKHSSLELIVSLFRQMYAYADIYELCDKDYSAHVKIKKPDDDESGVPFTDNDLKKMWENQKDQTVEMLLIMCYSGFRIGEYPDLEINLKEKYFRGGIKTESGKNRIVPIHSAILPLVERRLNRDHAILSDGPERFRKEMYSTLKCLGIDRHTPHDCRHTFSALCERYGVAENDRKRMLGHSFQDVTNKTYGHRSVKDLRHEIEKIKVCL